MVAFHRPRRTQTSANDFFGAQAVRVLKRQTAPFVLIMASVWAAAAAFNPGAFAAPSMVLASGAAAFVAALLAVGVRETLRDTAASGFSKLERRAGYPVLGGAPELTAQDLRDLPPDARTPIGCLVHKPSSAFAQASRNLQFAISDSQIVAFIGPVPNEGATTAALCATASASLQGLRAIVVDCDLRRRSLTRMMGPEPRGGVLEAAGDPDNWRTFVLEEPESGFHYLPAAAPASAWRNLFETRGFQALLARLRENYDQIVLDCPPALIAAEGVLLAGVADKSVVVIGWDATPMRQLRDTKRAFRHRGPEVSDLYVNRVPRLARPHQGRSHHGSSRRHASLAIH